MGEMNNGRRENISSYFKQILLGWPQGTDQTVSQTVYMFGVVEDIGCPEYKIFLCIILNEELEG